MYDSIFDDTRICTSLHRILSDNCVRCYSEVESLFKFNNNLCMLRVESGIIYFAFFVYLKYVYSSVVKSNYFVKITLYTSYHKIVIENKKVKIIQCKSKYSNNQD